MYMKVKTEADAWNLAYRIMPGIRETRDMERSDRAGYPIYSSSEPGTRDYICDLDNHLELNYDNGHSENIWIEDNLPKGAEVVVGIYKGRTIFGNVKVQDVKEICYDMAQGLTVKMLDDGRQGIEITLADGEITSFGNENVAYIRFN